MKTLSGKNSKHMYLTEKGHVKLQKTIMWLELWYCDDPVSVSKKSDQSFLDFENENPEIKEIPDDVKRELLKNYHDLLHNFVKFNLKTNPKLISE